MNRQQPQLDIRKIRKALKRTYKSYGRLLAIHCHGLDGKPAPSHRIQEWERNSRPVPAYIYRACAETVSDEWASQRHEAPLSNHAGLDEFFGSLLSPALGRLFAFSLIDAQNGKKVEISEIFIEHVQQMYGFDISYVWE